MAYLLAADLFRALDLNGDPLAGGQLLTYDAGTSTPKAAYQDRASLVPHTNPIILDDGGQALVWLNGLYRLNLLDSVGVQQPGWPLDQVGEPAGASGSILPGLTYHSKDATVVASPGAFLLTIAGFYPADALIEGVVWRIDTTFGASGGLTSFAIGDTGNMSRWGSQQPLLAGARGSAATWEGYAPFPTRSTGDLYVTAEGGAFDGTGQLTVRCFYRTFTL